MEQQYSRLAELIFTDVEAKAELSALVKAGIIPAPDVSDIIKVIRKPSFGRICRYLVAISDRKGYPKDTRPEDAYQQAMFDMASLFAEISKEAQPKT